MLGIETGLLNNYDEA